MGIIYKTTNLINGKIYIGKYLGKNKKYIGSGKLIKLAIKKYGKKNFIREIIEDNIDDPKLLNERERYWIYFYDSTNPDIGYNITKGGEGTFGYVMSDETKEKISKSRDGRFFGENNPFYGRTHTEEYKRWASESRTGIPNPRFSGSLNPMYGNHSTGSMAPAYGYRHTDEDKEKMSKNRKDRTQSEETKKKIGDAHRGEKSACFGTHHSEEEKESVSIKMIGIKKNRKHSSSRFVGVSYIKSSGMWSARMRTRNGNRIGINFETEIEAAMAYNEYLLEYYGWKVKDKLNIITDDEIKSLWED